MRRYYGRRGSPARDGDRLGGAAVSGSRKRRPPRLWAVRINVSPVDLSTLEESTLCHHRVAPEHPSVTESVVLPSHKEGVVHMPHKRLTSKLPSRETVQPACPMCQARMKRLHAVAGRPGFEHWTLRCTECGLIHEAQVAAAPIAPETSTWSGDELRPR
jgi:hypothetical protein